MSTTASEASKLLRAGVLEGVSLLLAGFAPGGQGAPGSLAEAVGSACAELGARVSPWQGDAVPPDTDMLVFDGAAHFPAGEAGREQGAGTAAESALSACMDAAWRATHAVINTAFLPAERGGRIVYLAPAPDAGRHADAARAALENLSRTLSIEWARFGVTLVTLAPGAHTSSGEVAAVSAYLASPAGAYFSGCLLDLRGAGVERPGEPR